MTKTDPTIKELDRIHENLIKLDNENHDKNRLNAISKIAQAKVYLSLVDNSLESE